MAWTARNNGLTGFALFVSYVAQHPSTRHLNNTSHELLIAAGDGIYHSVNGGRSWAKIVLSEPSNAEFLDTPAATLSDLVFRWVDYSPVNSDVVLALADNGFGAGNRQWLYKSSDNLATWTNRGILTA